LHRELLYVFNLSYNIVVDLPINWKVVGCKWIFKNKLKFFYQLT